MDINHDLQIERMYHPENFERQVDDEECTHEEYHMGRCIACGASQNDQ